MAGIDDALRAYLLTKTALTALISTRIYPDFAPHKAAFPYVIYLKVSDVKEHTHDGQVDLEMPNFQFTAYATTKAEARSVSNQIKAALCDYHGTLSEIEIPYITLINELSGAETTAEGAQKIFTEDLEFQVVFRRSD